MQKSRAHIHPCLLTLAGLWLVALICTGAEPKRDDTFLNVVTAQFPAWDANHDKVLSASELDALVADAKTTGTNAAVVAALKRAARNPKVKCPSLTLENIRDLTTNAPATDKPDFQKMYFEGLTRITNAIHRELFTSDLPRLDTIHQGKLGNCFCLAPLGAMVHRNPKQVADMFARQDDGTYRVTLGKQTVHVAPPTDSELAMSSSNEHAGIWVNIYEKAVGESRLETMPIGSRGAPLDAVARGGSAGTMMGFITGHEITRFSFKFAKDKTVSAAEMDAKLTDLRKQMTAAVKENRLMTCGTIKPTTPGLTPNHAYAVLGYDPKSDLVKLWNPYGQSFKPKGATGLANGYPTKDGILSLPPADFVQQFSGMAFEVPPVTAK